MFKASVFLSILASGLTLHNIGPTDTKKTVYTSFVPPSAERFFSPQAIPTASAKAVGTPFPSPFVSPYVYPPYSPYAVKQYPYYPPAPFYAPQPQQFIYPGTLGQSPVYYVQRYPAPTESGSEQGSSASGSGWGSYFPQSWQNFGDLAGYFPWSQGTSESEGSSPSPPAEAPQGNANKGKPEKLETTEPSQESGKSEAEKVELPEQQYVLLGQPQFFGHFAAFPADRDPSTLNGASKGAISSFLFYKDQTQQIPPQKINEIPNVPNSASVAYQRFLLLSKQRSEEGPKPAKVETSPQKEIVPENSNSTSAETTSTKSSVGEIAQVTPNAVAYAGIGGLANAAPVGTAFIPTSGLASSAPRATAIAGTSKESPDFEVVPAKKIMVARYTPERKYHIDTVNV